MDPTGQPVPLDSSKWELTTQEEPSQLKYKSQVLQVQVSQRLMENLDPRAQLAHLVDDCQQL